MNQFEIIDNNYLTEFEYKYNNITKLYSLSDNLRRLLKEYGFEFEINDKWLIHKETGYAIYPQLVDIEDINENSVKTLTSIQINHNVLFPNGISDIQPNYDNDFIASIEGGFQQWIQMNWQVLVDTLNNQSQNFSLEMSFNLENKEIIRRISLSGIAHYRQYETQEISSNEPHKFCPCCFITQNMDYFMPLIQSNETYFIRLFAYRNNGEKLAICQVNGQEYEYGKTGLLEYIDKWENCGSEFRKQYVIIRTIE